MLSIDKKDLKSIEIVVNTGDGNDPYRRFDVPCSKGIREIARIYSHNPRYGPSPNGEMSIYLIPDNVYYDLLKKEPRFLKPPTNSMIEEAKRKSGRMGKKVGKKEIEMLRIAMEGNIPNEDLDDFIKHMKKMKKDKECRTKSCSLDNLQIPLSPPPMCEKKIELTSDAKSDAMSKVYQSMLSFLEKKDYCFNDLDYTDSNTGETYDGELVPLPIVQPCLTPEKIAEIRSGKTYFSFKCTNKVGDVITKDVAILGDYVNDLIESKTYKYKGIDCEVILNADEEDDKGPRFVEYKPTGEEMIEISYIYGPNRSGKTYYAAKYATLWSEIFKDWPIYLFSRRDMDKVLDDIPKLERIKIDQSLVDEPLSMTDFSHSLVIFDDVDTISDKGICLAVQKLRNDIMETGRQKMIYVINTSHLGMNYGSTRTVLHEANSYTLFPRKGNYEHNYKILQHKMGMRAKDIRSILDSPDGLGYKGKWGWVTVYKDSPQYVIYENGCRLL